MGGDQGQTRSIFTLTSLKSTTPAWAGTARAEGFDLVNCA